MYELIDLTFPHKVSVANLPSKRLTSNLLSAQYLLLSGNIADLVPFCLVAFNVSLAWSMLIQKASANCAAVTLECLSVDIYDQVAFKSSNALSYFFVVLYIFLLVKTRDGSIA